MLRQAVAAHRELAAWRAAPGVPPGGCLPGVLALPDRGAAHAGDHGPAHGVAVRRLSRDWAASLSPGLTPPCRCELTSGQLIMFAKHAHLLFWCALLSLPFCDNCIRKVPHTEVQRCEWPNRVESARSQCPRYMLRIGNSVNLCYTAPTGISAISYTPIECNTWAIRKRVYDHIMITLASSCIVCYLIAFAAPTSRNLSTLCIHDNIEISALCTALCIYALHVTKIPPTFLTGMYNSQDTHHFQQRPRIRLNTQVPLHPQIVYCKRFS